MSDFHSCSCATGDCEKTVWTLMGGTSTEHDVSMTSGRQVASALAGGHWRVRPVIIDRTGRWRVNPEWIGPQALPEAIRDAIAHLAGADGRAQSCEEALSLLRAESPACVFIALHGPGGEDGAIQGLFDWLSVPYTGSGMTASALAMDKIRAQILFRALGLKTPASVSSLDIAPDERHDFHRCREELVRLCRERLTPPYYVKPCVGGSSVGVTRVREGADLPDALETAFETAGEVLIESGIMGRELTCGVLDGDDSEGRLRPQALPVTEICPVQSEYFDYTAKYTPGACQEITPANLSEADTARVQAAALTAHCGLGCRGMSRSDFMLAPDGDLYILETNTIPGMTPTSLLPQAAAAAGLDYLGLCEAIIASALRVSHVL